MRTTGVFVVIGLTLALSGCVGSAYPAFDRPATAADALPAEFASTDLEIDVNSARLEATHDGVDIYVFRTTAGLVCVGFAGDGAHAACATEGGLIEVGGPAFSAQLVAEPARDSDGYIAISDNIRVKPNP